MRAVEKIKLNLVPGGSPGGILPRVRVSQGDAQDRILQFEVYDGNEAASLSGIVSCYIGGTKPDGNGFTVDCTKNTNIVTAVLTDQATVLPGNIRCKLYLLSSTGSVRSASFELDVDPDPLADAGTSDTDITAIVQAAAMYAREAGEAAATAVSSAWDAMGASWEENHEYTVDDMVIFGQDDGGQGHIYKCILTHTSSDAILPTDTTYWEDTTLCAQISSLNSNLAKKMYNPNYGGFKLYFPQGWGSCKLYFFRKSVNVPANGDQSVKFEFPDIGGIPYVFVTPYVTNSVWCYCTYMISSLTSTGGYIDVHNLEGTAHNLNLSIIVAY